MKSTQKWSKWGDSAPKNEEIQLLSECSSNRAMQFFQILTTLRLAPSAQA